MVLEMTKNRCSCVRSCACESNTGWCVWGAHLLEALFDCCSEALVINLRNVQFLWSKTCLVQAEIAGIRLCKGGTNNSMPVFLSLSLSLSALTMDLQLDWLKQRGAVKRILFMDTHQHQRTQQLVLGQGDRQHCHNYSVYLRVSLIVHTEHRALLNWPHSSWNFFFYHHYEWTPGKVNCEPNQASNSILLIWTE